MNLESLRHLFPPDLTIDEIRETVSALTPAQYATLTEHLDALSKVPPTGLMEFVPWLSPKFIAPKHLQPLVDALERSLHEPVRLLVSTPPRHGKTELLLHFIAWVLSRNPAAQIAYISHTDRLARTKSGKARQLAITAGVPISDDTAAKHDWRTGVDEGGVWATSTGGAVVGLGFTHMIIDDPVKGRVDVESAVQREKDFDWFNGDCFNRLEPSGSVIVNMARWHEDDLIGRLAREKDANGDPVWTYINLPAVDEDGVPLWEDRWSVERLAEIRGKSEYDWVSLYMGQPRPRSGKLFDGAHVYSALPATMQVAVGVDLAYTAKTSSDWSVAVVIGQHDGKWYILDVVRRQVRADDFATELLTLQKRWPAAKMNWYCSTTERGSADLLKRLGVRITGTLAGADKYIRAQGVAAAWKAGKVYVPEQASWMDDFLRVVNGFTGINDLEDDDVDALAAGFDFLPARAVVVPPKHGTPEWHEAEAKKMIDEARQRAVNRKSGSDPRDPFFAPRRS